MERIKQLHIVPSLYGKTYVSFLDAIDVAHKLNGRTFRPNTQTWQTLRRIIRDKQMVCDLDILNGIITATVREIQ
jgi:hypothetical protein